MLNIRNFSIIAHIDHGKSTLADRMLEMTGTIEKRKMKEQVLDSMELERERGITIKMTPVSMKYKLTTNNSQPTRNTEEGFLLSVDSGESSVSSSEYILNLIDTPGHIDFSYEVSRAIKAVEGALLLIDATQGVQAQTLTTLQMARQAGLVIIPVLNKIDSSLARIEEVSEEIVSVLKCSKDEIMKTSGKTGEGVKKLLEVIIEKIPPPKILQTDTFRSLVFDFQYSNHQGIILYTRIVDGKVSRGGDLLLKAVRERFQALEVGTFSPEPTPKDALSSGEIGYIVTGIKRPGVASVGDTVTLFRKQGEALPGYEIPRPVVWASVYPESQSDLNSLRQALERLKLTDSSLSFEEEQSGSLGRGFRCGFLGMLHLEIITERLRREFDLELIITTPSIIYEVVYGQGSKKGKREKIYTPSLFPDHGLISEIFEPWVKVQIIVPVTYLGNIMQLMYTHEAEVGETTDFADGRTSLIVFMPLRELMRNFFDEIKSVSSGFASLSYEMSETRKADVARLDILVAEEVVPAFSRVVSKMQLQEEAEKAVEKLYSVLPKQLFTAKIQAKALGRILSSRTKEALKKNVTAHMYGGDITRKKKLWEKQKRGKEKLKERGKVNIPQEVFLKMMRGGN
ncbi:MAG: translation elongation factor 4 [Patescibacteria group bacterium]